MDNLSLLSDFYALTMMQGHFYQKKQETAVFEIFFRQSSTFNYAIAAGLEEAIKFVQNIKFGPDEIKYLRNLKVFSEDFLDYLSSFKFKGNIRAVPEGTVIFPGEPIFVVEADIKEAMYIEAGVLNIINHQTLIATKASRICLTAGDKPVIEFGLRRAQGPDAGIYGTRSAIIGGCQGTSNVLAGQKWDIPVKGTHSHGWVLSFPSELEAFRAYAKAFPDSCLLLVDTYDTLKSGVPNAIKVFDELKRKGHKPLGIRLDSGDLAYLSVTARKMLDEAGHKDAKIFASGDLDENVILHLNAQGACIDMYGIGTKLITSQDNPSLGGVYKIVATKSDGKITPKMKLSDSFEKITFPGIKELYRIYNKSNGYAEADLIALQGEIIPKPLTIIHPIERWKTTTFEDYDLRSLLADVMIDGKVVYDFPKLQDIAKYCKQELNTFWPEYKRISNPHIYKVDLSDALYELKQELIQQIKSKKSY
ncbi:MAG TPA: nicotinate phosphoribosyltransferase [Clostridiales bacterium]|jgi:nicotinate phosphoribosyltransferase|nr:nicotinate phosphoribosyltransferase [Clostridiales bacterium]